VLCELLGVPVPDREWILASVLAYGSPGRPEESQRVTRELAAYLTGLIAARRAQPGGDLLSALVLAPDEGAGGGLSGTELLSAAFQLIMAGFDTTVNLIASGTLALLTHPAQMARLRADPSLLPAAVEELLRFANPLKHATDRFTTEDVTIGDVVIPVRHSLLPGRSPGPHGSRGRPRCAAPPLPGTDARGPRGGTALASCQPYARPGVPPGPPRLSSPRPSRVRTCVLIRMKRGRVPRFGAAQWTMTGWQKTMSPGSPVSSTTRRGTPSTTVSPSMKAALRPAGDGACPVSAISQG
jgi:hypothetical protein